VFGFKWVTDLVLGGLGTLINSVVGGLNDYIERRRNAQAMASVGAMAAKAKGDRDALERAAIAKGERALPKSDDAILDGLRRPANRTNRNPTGA